MDPVLKIWMFENWLQDQNDNIELAKNHAYLLASFDHPEEVGKLTGNSGNVHISTEEEFEESTKMVRDFNLKSLGSQKNRRRKQIIKE